MTTQDPHRFTLLQVIAGGFALAGAVAAIAWNVRSDRIAQLERTISGYEQSKNLELAAGLKSVREASDRLANHLRDFENVQRLRSDNAALTKQLSELQRLRGELASSQASLAAKEKFIRSLLPDVERFTLKRGQSKSMVGARVTVGFVEDYLSRVELLVNNNKQEILPGQEVPVKIGDRECRLVLENYDRSGAPTITMALYCEK